MRPRSRALLDLVAEYVRARADGAADTTLAAIAQKVDVELGALITELADHHGLSQPTTEVSMSVEPESGS